LSIACRIAIDRQPPMRELGQQLRTEANCWTRSGRRPSANLILLAAELDRQASTNPAEGKVEQLTSELIALSINERNPSPPAPRHESELAAHAQGFKRAAGDEMRRATVMFALAGAASLSAIGASFYASTIPPFSDTNTPWRLIFPGSIALVSLAAAVILLVAGKNSHRRSTRNDATGSALAALESYLAPLPEPAQYLIRATMTTNLLQVSGTDADLLMLNSWPSPSDLMTTIYGYAESSESGGSADADRQGQAAPTSLNEPAPDPGEDEDHPSPATA